MNTKAQTFSHLAAVLAFSAALALPAHAQQPQTKLVSVLDEATIQAAWCSAVFLEESLWYEDGPDFDYYDGLSVELEGVAAVGLEEAGLRDVEREELWGIFDEAAYDLAGTDEEGYIAELEACEAAFGTPEETDAASEDDDVPGAETEDEPAPETGADGAED